ncbi:hypothetical protein DL768_003471 [Monosporascus sp. mg162]|nr:hypothetical protein DL768_003471 [Monosporascus sp. mg162]
MSAVLESNAWLEATVLGFLWRQFTRPQPLPANIYLRDQVVIITRSNEFPESTISVWTIDLESYTSTRAFAEQCATLPRIDIVILNAGLAKPSYAPVPETGYEVTLQVSYLSTALLGILLLPILRAQKVTNAPRPPVLTIMGSGMMHPADIEVKGEVLQQFNRPQAFSQFP